MSAAKQAILFGSAIILSSSFVWLPKFNTININGSSTQNQDICTYRIDSLTEIIVDQRDQIHFLRDEIQFKESEVSYWGHKYDSIKQNLK